MKSGSAGSLVRASLGAAIVCIVVGGLAAPSSDYLIYVATAATWLAIMAISFDVVLGYTGYLSLAHGTLYGVGAYTCANLTAKLGWNFWLALPVSGLVAALVGALVAAAAIRTKGLYFAVITLGMGLIGYQLFVFLQPLTGGIGGFVGIPSPPPLPGLAGNLVLSNLFVALFIAWLTFVTSYLFCHSRIGTACLAIREDATLAQAMGIRIGLPRLAAFTFSGFFAGVTGALFAAGSNFVGPDSFGVLTTGFHLVVAVVIGGMGSLWGPALGAVILTSLPEILRGASTFSLLAYGGLLLLFVLFAPHGIAGLIRNAIRRRKAAVSSRNLATQAANGPLRPEKRAAP